MNLGLEGKVALVCGASRGLGRRDRRGARRRGRAPLAVCSRDAERLAAAAAEIGPDVLAVPADLAVAGEPTRVVEETLERFGRLDVLVANTGGPPGRDRTTRSRSRTGTGRRRFSSGARSS